MPVNSIYVASKVIHAEVWKMYRRQGIPIISTWIDEAKPGETKDYTEFWTRCLDEIARCDSLVFYLWSFDTPAKGAYLELGAALALEKRVLVVDHSSIDHTFIHHPLIEVHPSLDQAFKELGYAIE